MKNLFKITHLISALTMFFTLIAISHKTFAYVHYNEVEIDTSSGAVSFFDMKTLNEIIAESENFPLETLAQKIDDFFSSAPLSVDGRGGFYMMGPNDAYNIRNIPEEHRQRNPVYKIPSQVTIAFAQAYALFISKNLVHFTKALEAAVEFNLTVDQAKVSYNYFYTCLRSVALFAGPNSIDCAPDALKRIGFQRPAEALHLANLYIKLYRASRFAFRALAKKNPKDRDYAPKVRTYEPIDLDDLVVQFHCVGAVESATRIYNAKMAFTRVPLPGGFWSSMAWEFGGNKQLSQKMLKLYSAIPDFQSVSGAYFDGYGGKERRGYRSDHEENWKKICGETFF